MIYILFILSMCWKVNIVTLNIIFNYENTIFLQFY